MAELIPQKTATAEYAFRFDALPERVTLSNQIEITGWLLHRRGLPIHGIRGVVRGALRHRLIFRARRKRSRPLIAAAYPDLPEAGQSGFLLVLGLPVGRSKVTIQVQDHKKIWRTIFVTDIWAFPLTFLGRLGLPRVEQFLSTYLSQRFVGNRRNAANSVQPNPLDQLERGLPRERLQSFRNQGETTRCEIRAVDLFVTSQSNLFIREIADLLCAGFRSAGCEAQLLIDQIPAEKTEEGKVQIVVTPHEFFNLFLRDKLSWEKMQRLTNHLFLVGTEQPESEWLESNLIVAPHARAMLDIHPSGVAAYRARGVRCFHLPLGYEPLLEQTEQPVNSVRDTEICLLAAMTKRREQFVAANADFFAARNCHIRFVPISFAKTKETRSYLPALQRNALLQRTKILLNVHYSDLRYFEWHRALVAMANRCCLVTETSEGFEPLVPGKHFVMAERDDLTMCCEYYLNHEAEREAIVTEAYDFLRERFTQEAHCRSFLQHIDSEFEWQNVEAPEIEGNAAQRLESEPLPDALAKHLSRKPTALFLSALREDVSRIFTRGNQKSAPTDGQSMDPVNTAHQLTVLRDMRRSYVERFEVQKKSQEQDEAIFQSIDNPCFNDNTPAISVIVTLYNYGAYIRQCLKSLEESHTATIPGGIEIVIVNDASTDDSLKQAMVLQRFSRHPVRIVDKRFNTGLPDARNLGLQLARAPHVFILDADNMLYPRALEQLHSTIVRTNSAAAYSMLCRFQGAHNNQQGLLSYYDWDPQMLVEFPYVDAMAMFDREQLIKIGGYDNELYKLGWFGWEDYDLWLRIAGAGLRVSFLPNVLCLYRHHDRAMSNTTNLFERELVAHLLQKHRALIDSSPPKRRILGVKRSQFDQTAETNTHGRKSAEVYLAQTK